MSEFAGQPFEGTGTGSGAISVLHVDDEPSFAEMVAAFLERTDAGFEVETAESAAEGRKRLENETFDCVVSDYDMNEQNGIEFLRAVRRDHPRLPFILYTGKGSEEVASEAISAGVTDYLQKESGTTQYRVLANRIQNAVERQRVRSQLADRERHLRLFFERSPLGVIEWNESFEVVRMNGTAEEILGYEEAELKGQPWTAIVPEGDQSKVESVLPDFLNSGGFQLVNENRRKDGSRIVCEWHNRAVTDEDDEVVSLFSQFQDITDRQRQTRRIETLVDNLPGMVYRCGNEPGWPMEYVGGEAEPLTGYSAERLEAESSRYGEEIIHPEDREGKWESIQTALAEGRQFEVTYRIVTANGETRWVWERGQGIYEGDEVVAIEGFVTDVTEREETAQELREEREFIAQVLNSMNDVFYVINEEGQFVRWNDEVTAVTDCDDETIDGMDALELFPPDEREHVSKAITQVLTEGKTTVTAALRTADGGATPYEFAGARLTDADGNLQGLVGIGRDISERVERERALEETNTVLSTMVETLPVGVLAKDGEGTVTAVNEEMLGLFNIDASPETVRGKRGDWVLDRAKRALEEPEAFVEGVREVISERQAVDNETLRMADGRTIRRAYRPVSLPDGDGDLWVFQDVTGRVKTERKLTALHDIADELTEIDSVQEVCERTIEASEEILDFDLSAIDLANEGRLEKGAVSAETPPEGSKTMSTDEGVVGKTYRTQRSFLIEDVQEVPEANPQGPYRAAISIPIGDHGVFQAVAREPGVFDERDLELAELLVNHTENAFTRIVREQELERRNERLDDFTGIVSHDLRNPLNVAQGRIELAHEETGNENLEAAADAVDRSLELIDDLLELARQGGETHDLEPVALSQTATDCWDLVETTGATLVVNTEHTVQADESRLSQLFENLFRNAVEHGANSGQSADSADGEPSLTVTVGDCEGGFYVADDGPGIPEGEREEVFDPGYSGSKSESTGFGLSIVRRVAEAHGWDVRVTASEDGGARFEVTGVESV